MAQGGYTYNGKVQTNNFGNRNTSTFISGLHDYSLRPGDSYQNILDWSFDDEHEMNSLIDERESVASLEFQSKYSSSDCKDKKVQFISDTDTPPRYQLHKNSMCKVSFPGKTWDIMMQGFRIALEMDNVFICNNFLGPGGASALLQELWYLRNTGEFDQHMRKGPQCSFSSMYMLEQNKSHRQLDALVLMVYKLALYYTDQWEKISVELCYYPEGYPSRTFSADGYGSERQILKCIYFPNAVEEEIDTPGLISVNTPHRATRVEPVMDRLIVFWGDQLEYTVNQSKKEQFGINLFLQR